ncbi:MAG TPA: hypothetical protein VHL80_10595 [Polyangia bacterium]|nr:hypothetical protein [Polyangia bacterium]
MLEPRNASTGPPRAWIGWLVVVAAALGCSSGARSSDGLIDVMLGDAGAPACLGDAAAPPACWAVGRLTSSSGCTDTHCDRDGGLLMRTANYAECGLATPDPSVDAPPSVLAAELGALSLYDDLCEFHATVLPTCDGDRSLVLEAELTSMAGKIVPSGAAPYIEAYSSPVHPAPSTGGGMETTTGSYRIGPVTFDQPGTWTVILHFFGGCRDSLQESPHAHVTMSLEVP